MDDRILAVQRMQDYIEAHLHEQVSLGDLARVSLFSPWLLLGETPGLGIIAGGTLILGAVFLLSRR